MTLLLVAGMLSCGVEHQSESTLYPIDSLLKHQVTSLVNAKADLKKTALMGAADHQTTYTPDNKQWEKEFEILWTLDKINKPVNQRDYKVVDGVIDSRSNLKVKIFSPKENLTARSLENLSIRSLRIYYQDDSKELRRIEADLQEKNYLYQSTRLVRMEFQQVDNKTMLTSYFIDGGQKMYLGDTVTYAVSGAVTIPN